MTHHTTPPAAPCRGRRAAFAAGRHAGLALLLAAALAGPAAAAERFTVTVAEVSDPKAVFATVESRNVVPARARIGGTVVDLVVGDGDKVAAGETIALVADDKLALQIKSLDAEIAGLEAQLDKARIDLARAKDLFDKGTVAKSRLDEAATAVDVAAKALDARSASRSVIEQQVAEGAVLAPAAGRVLAVPVTAGAVVMAGETMASIAEENFILRLSVPERHARYMKAGDPVRLDAAAGEAPTGTIVLVYPEIANGRVTADAEVVGLGDYFVGERVRVFIAAAARPAIVVPAAYVTTRYGADHVLVDTGGAEPVEVPVQRGEPFALPGLPDGLEILSGLRAGDILVHP
ncbi:MAG TPA: efflux RND transporter periplasmic adaptor subunit [Bauldia sp.]|nr:efflux RND transporter periplasmic adaptor subunit [Bauldia sp.]